MSHKIVIYQTLAHLFGNKNTTRTFDGTMQENGVGKFADFDDSALRYLKDFGYTHLYITGILEHATTTDYSGYGIANDYPEIVKGRAGAPFAVKDYYDVNPDLATDVWNREQEFEQLVRRIHAYGLKIIIDFIPNHLARQYYSDSKPAMVNDFGENDDDTQAFLPQNNFYYLPNQAFKAPKGNGKYSELPAKATGNDVFNAHPTANDWYETVKLNYGIDYLNGHASYFDTIPDTWLKMRNILIFWARKGVDGFRCDMAELVPVEFWHWVISAIKQEFSDLIFIAETYNPSLYQKYLHHGGFDYLYDKVGLYDTLRSLAEGKKEASVQQITRIWQEESGGFSEKMLRFLENHDEQRIASRFFCTDAFKAIPAMVVTATLHSSPIMLYFGQEVGEASDDAEGFNTANGRTTMFDYWGVIEHQKLMNNGAFDGGGLSDSQKKIHDIYKNLIQFCQQNEAIYAGLFYDLQYTNAWQSSYNEHRVYSYLRYSDNQKLLIVCNFDHDNEYCTDIHIPVEAWQAMGIHSEKSYSFKTVFQFQNTIIQKNGQLFNLHLNQNSLYIFEILIDS